MSSGATPPGARRTRARVITARRRSRSPALLPQSFAILARDDAPAIEPRLNESRLDRDRRRSPGRGVGRAHAVVGAAWRAKLFYLRGGFAVDSLYFSPAHKTARNFRLKRKPPLGDPPRQRAGQPSGSAALGSRPPEGQPRCKAQARADLASRIAQRLHVSRQQIRSAIEQAYREKECPAWFSRVSPRRRGAIRGGARR